MRAGRSARAWATLSRVTRGESAETRALVALAEAERITRKIVRRLRWRAFLDQLALGSRPELEEAQPGTLTSALGQPAWVWMLFAAMITLLGAPVPGAPVAMVISAIAALVVRTCLTIQYAPKLFVPNPAARAELEAALAASDQAIRALPGESYRQEPVDWAGDDPTRSPRPWTELATIRRTAAALRRRALPPGRR